MDKYGLIGYPLGHSFSISYFNQRFQDEGINAVYENFEIPTIEALDEVLNLNPELKGLNVTIPYKEKVIPYLDSISPEARAIGAVNVIKVSHEGKSVKLKGYNSYVIGFTKSIEPMIEKKWHKKEQIKLKKLKIHSTKFLIYLHLENVMHMLNNNLNLERIKNERL